MPVTSTRQTWHAAPAKQVMNLLGVPSVRGGLSSLEVASLLSVVGPNELTASEGRKMVEVLAAQFTSLIIWLLIAAALVSAFLGEWVDAAVIGAIVVEVVDAELASALGRAVDRMARQVYDTVRRCRELRPQNARSGPYEI